MKAFLVGLGLGALVGVAYAPRSGRETRRELQDRARQSAENASEKVNALREQIGRARTQVTSATQELKRGVRSFGQQQTFEPGNEAQAGFGSGTENASGRNNRTFQREPRSEREESSVGPAQQWGASQPDTEMAIGGDVGGEASDSAPRSGTFLEVINEWPEERLITIHGIGPVLASKIISNRPYETEGDLVDSKELPPS